MACKGLSDHRKPDMATEALKDPACSDGSPVAVRALILKASQPLKTHNLLLAENQSAWKIERLATCPYRSSRQHLHA